MTIQKAAKNVSNSGKENLGLVLKVLKDDNYEGFILDLNELAKNDKDNKVARLRDALVNLYNNNSGAVEIKTNTVDLPILDIQPTLSEVDMEKSLKFPLSLNPNGIDDVYSGEPVLIIKPIVVAKIGKKFYVIDGHHRWSQVYCLNPKAKMTAFVVEQPILFKTPDDVLKIVLMQIFIDKKGKELPLETADSGYNLYTIKEKAFKDWCNKTMSDEAVDKLISYVNDAKDTSDKEDQKNLISNGLWKNVLVMRLHAKPISGAHRRDDMPLTGYTADKLGNLEGLKATKLSNESKNIKYTKSQIVEAIRYWEKQLRKINESKKIISEDLKNALLGFLGVRSNFVELEDLIDSMHKGTASKFKLISFAERLQDDPHYRLSKNASKYDVDEVEEALTRTLIYKMNKSPRDRRYSRIIKVLAYALTRRNEELADMLAKDNAELKAKIAKDNAERRRLEKAKADKEAANRAYSNRSSRNGQWTYDPGYADERNGSPWHYSD